MSHLCFQILSERWNTHFGLIYLGSKSSSLKPWTSSLTPRFWRSMSLPFTTIARWAAKWCKFRGNSLRRALLMIFWKPSRRSAKCGRKLKESKKLLMHTVPQSSIKLEAMRRQNGICSQTGSSFSATMKKIEKRLAQKQIWAWYRASWRVYRSRNPFSCGRKIPIATIITRSWGSSRTVKVAIWRFSTIMSKRRI